MRNGSGQSLQGAQAVLVPIGQPARRDLYKVAKTDADGRFDIRGIVPGDYKLFAWEDLPRFAYFDPGFLREYEALGTNLHIEEGTEEKADIVARAAQH